MEEKNVNIAEETVEAPKANKALNTVITIGKKVVPLMLAAGIGFVCGRYLGNETATEIVETVAENV